MQKQNRTIHYTLDHNGKSIVIVSLPRNRRVTLYRSDFDALIALGLSPLWHYNKTKGVVAWLKKWRRWGSLARLIADAGSGTNVLFRDGDKLNCRSDNLIVSDDNRGGAKLRYRDGVKPVYGWYDKVTIQTVPITI
jgi:hypothetical protein